MATRTEYAHGTPNWVDLATPDPDGARRFYGAVLGWSFEEVPTDQGAPYVMARLGGDNVAGLMQQPPDMAEQGMPAMWTTYVAVDDADRAAATATAEGGTVVVPPMDVMTAGRMAVVVDPCGAAVGCWERRDHVGADRVNEPGTLCWNELQADDPTQAEGFYRALFGWGTQQMDMGDGQTYTVWTVGEAGVGGAMKSPMPGVPPHWSTVFAVADTDAACAAVRDNGGTVIVEPFDMMVGRLAVVGDPSGAVFQVLAMNPPAEG